MSAHSRIRLNDRKFCRQALRLVAGKLFLELVIEVPQLQKAHEVRIAIGEPGVLGIGLFLTVQRPLARVLHLQGRGNDQHLAQATFFLGRKDHASDPRVDRQPAQLTPNLGKLAILVQRAQFKERLVPIADRVASRRVEERKPFDVA